MLRNPCILWGLQKEEQKDNWLPHPCLLGSPRGQNCYVTPTFSGLCLGRVMFALFHYWPKQDMEMSSGDAIIF